MSSSRSLSNQSTDFSDPFLQRVSEHGLWLSLESWHYHDFLVIMPTFHNCKIDVQCISFSIAIFGVLNNACHITVAKMARCIWVVVHAVNPNTREVEAGGFL